MAVTQSSLTFADARTRVAEAAGAAGTTAEITRAGSALQYAFQHWNNFHPWQFLLATATASVSAGTPDYTLPSNFKQVYDVRLVNRTLWALQLRHYDRMKWNQSASSTPTHYSLFHSGMTGGVRITLLPTPSSADTLTLKYYRGLTVPTAAASATALDIPEDYELYILALAKYFYLLDKGGPQERLAGWKQIADEGMRIAIASESRYPDQEKLMIPEGGLGFPSDSFNTPDLFYPISG